MADSFDYFGSPTMGQPGSTGQFDWTKRLPYSYEQPGGFQGSQAQQSAPLFSPNQSAQPPAQQPVAAMAQTANVPQSYNFGPDQQEDAGLKSEAFASSLGQGVLGASQNAVRQAGMLGQKKPGQQQGGDPYGSINQGGGWNVGGMSGMGYT